MTTLTGTEIVAASQIGKTSDDVKFLDGHTMAEYKAMLAKLADKAISLIPAAVSETSKEDAKISLDEMYRRACHQMWTTSIYYYSTMQDGRKGLTQINKQDIGDVIRILCNLIDQD